MTDEEKNREDFFQKIEQIHDEPNEKKIFLQQVSTIPDDTEERLKSKFKPITCPCCGRHNLAYVSQYHKCIKERIISFILLFFLLLCCYTGFIKDDSISIIGVIILAVLYICCHIKILITESKTHVQCVCKDCGRVWLHE